MTSDINPAQALNTMADQAHLNRLVMQRLGARMMDPAFQEQMRLGDSTVVIAEIKAMFEDQAFVTEAFPGASPEELAAIREQMTNDGQLNTALHNSAKQARTQQIDKQLLDVVKLAMRASRYRTLFISDLTWRILPPLMLGQCQFMVDKDGTMVAFVSWAKLNAQVAKRMESPMNFRMQEHEWTCGDLLRIIDVISPFGQEEKLAREVSEKLLAQTRHQSEAEPPRTVN
nr:toxin-activating lysine-acyltransferase [uncultured Gellertiella sp.]